MKILIFMSGGFDTYGPSRHLYDALIEDLLLTGQMVHLIESHSSGIDPDVPLKFLNNNNFTYDIVKTNVVNKKAFVKRYLTGVVYCFKTKKVLKTMKNSFDVAMVQSCPWAPFAVSFVKKYVKVPVLWNIQDMFPGAAVANGAMKSKLVISLFSRFQRIAYKKADYITVISEDMRKKVIEQKVSNNKIYVIHDWFDDKTVEEISWDNNLFVKKYNLDKKKVYVQYAGTMGRNFDYKVVIEVAKLLINDTDIVFQMIGFGSQLDSFKKAAFENNLANIVFLPLEPQEMVSHVYSACTVCLIPLPKGVIGNSVPSKAGLLMACKRPIITTADSDSDYCNMINHNKIGFAFKTNEFEKIADSILFIKNNRSVGQEFGINGYTFGHDIFSRSKNTKKYIDLFERISKKE